MARSQVRHRPLYAYSIHGHDGPSVLNYLEFFSALAAVDPLSRQTSVGDEVVAITAMLPTGHRWSIRFVSGIQGLPPLFYDPETGTESTANIGTRIVVTASWAFVDPVKRFAVVDRRRPGVPVAVMAKALSHLGRELGLAESLTLSLNPVPSPSFLTELDRFDRVRQAAVVLSRPNYNWQDSATALAGYASESDAGTAELEMSAERGRTLSQTRGIVADIRVLASHAISGLKNLRITGTRSGESRETTLSLASHQERRFVPVDWTVSVAAERDMLQSAATAFLDDLPEVDTPIGS